MTRTPPSRSSASCASARNPDRARRLRNRLLVAQLPSPLPDRHPEDRAGLRRRRGRHGRAMDPRPGDHLARQGARPAGHRRGGRATQPGPASPERRLRARPGILLRPSAARRSAGRGVRARQRAAPRLRSDGPRHCRRAARPRNPGTTSRPRRATLRVMRFALMTEPQQGMSYDEILALALAAEAAGLEAFFRSDHYGSFAGPARWTDDRCVGHPRRPGPRHLHDPDRVTRLAGHLPHPRQLRQGRGHRRRDERRARRGGDGRRLERGGARGARDPVPAAEGTLRPAGGVTGDPPRPVDRARRLEL